MWPIVRNVSEYLNDVAESGDPGRKARQERLREAMTKLLGTMETGTQGEREPEISHWKSFNFWGRSDECLGQKSTGS
jgi:hypothetical protein